MMMGLMRWLKWAGLTTAVLRAWQIVERLRAPYRIRRYLNRCDVPRLQLGAGINVLNGWLNTDMFPHPRYREVVFLDARRRFPLPDCTFQYVFSEHLIEHMEYQDGVRMLGECFRVLRPGGRIRIATPDLRALLDLYRADKTDLQQRYIAWAVDTYLPEIGIYQDVFVINNFFRNWGHRFIYDEKALTDALLRVGFREVRRCEVGDSPDIHLKGLESHGRFIGADFNRLETLVLEAVRPQETGGSAHAS